MLIEIERMRDGQYKADLKELPGMPPIGCASTPEEAVARLLFKVLHACHIGGDDWLRYIDFRSVKVTNIDNFVPVRGGKAINERSTPEEILDTLHNVFREIVRSEINRESELN